MDVFHGGNPQRIVHPERDMVPKGRQRRNDRNHVLALPIRTQSNHAPSGFINIRKAAVPTTQFDKHIHPVIIVQGPQGIPMGGYIRSTGKTHQRGNAGILPTPRQFPARGLCRQSHSIAAPILFCFPYTCRIPSYVAGFSLIIFRIFGHEQ